MAQMVVRVVSIGATDYVLGRAEHARHVVDRHTKLQKHSCAGVAQNVWGDIGAKARQVRAPYAMQCVPLSGLADQHIRSRSGWRAGASARK